MPVLLNQALLQGPKALQTPSTLLKAPKTWR